MTSLIDAPSPGGPFIHHAVRLEGYPLRLILGDNVKTGVCGHQRGRGDGYGLLLPVRYTSLQRYRTARQRIYTTIAVCCRICADSA